MTGDDLARAAARLAHDVGKHVARAARNVRQGSVVPDALVRMLADDLYAIDGDRPASAVLEARAAPLSDRFAEHLEPCRALLAEADGLRPRVEAGEPRAVQRAAALAREVEDRLRALARELAPQGEGRR